MKKNYWINGRTTSFQRWKTFLIMKLISVFILGFMIQSYAVEAQAQDKRLTLQFENNTLKEVLQKLESQTEFSFIYKDEMINPINKVSGNFRDEKVTDLLNEILQNSGLTYTIKGRAIVILSLDNETVMEQQKSIKGKVTDSSGASLPGVSVIIKGTTTGVITDVDGKYSLAKVPENATLQFSFVGMKSQEIMVVTQTSINVVLVDEAIGIEEVVAVGYGTQKKATLTGSVTSIKGAEVLKSPVMNVSNSLAGRLPGVTFVTQSGEPGADGALIRVRGVNTLGNNNALVVVDGVPGRSLDRIDPNSIESISVLKDASSAIYGSEAANGVILITTKRGKTGKPLITVNVNEGYSQPTKTPKLLNATEYATAMNEVYDYRSLPPMYSASEIAKFADGSEPWLYPNTDWFAATYKDWAKQNSANVNLTGGTESVRYFVSLGSKYQDAYYKNSATNYKQVDFRTNLDADVNKYISVRFDISGRMEDRNYPTRSAGDIMWMLVRGKPTQPAYWPNGKPGPDIEFGNNPVVISTSETGYNRSKNYSLNSNFKLKIKVPWVKGLSLTGTAAVDKGFDFGKNFTKPWYLYTWDKVTYDSNKIPVLQGAKRGVDQATLYENMADRQDILLNSLITYENTFGDHTINFLAGIETREGKGDFLNAYRGYFESTVLDQLDAGGATGLNNGGSAYRNARLNYFGRVNYNYKSKYLAEFVWRYDGSYIFPEAGRFGFFPGVSLGWRISEEDFWKDNISFINNFKIRGSYGTTGNDRIDEWQYLASYAFINRNSNPLFNIDQEQKALYQTRVPNPNVTWEVAKQADIGFDASFLKDKLTATFDYFNYKRSNILWYRNASVPATSGLSLPRENIGKVTNNGFDFDIAYRDRAGNLGYEITVNGGYAKNKITFWDEAPGVPDYQKSTGHPMPTDPGNSDGNLFYQAIGIFKDQAAVDAYPHWAGARPGDIIFKDVSGDGKIDGNDRVRSDKTNIPTFQGGMGFRLTFKQFDLSLLLQGQAGAEAQVSVLGGEFGNYLKSDYDGRWTTTNTDASKPRTSNRQEEYWRANQNSYFNQKTDFIRLKNLEFGYNLPALLNSKLGIQGLRIYMSGLNLFTYCPGLKDFDPENIAGSFQGSSGAYYFTPRVVNLGLSLTF